MKFFARVIFVVCLWCVCLVGSSCYAQEKITAVVNNDVITQKDYDTFLNFTRMQLSSEFLGDKLEAKMASLKKDVLQRLIEDRLLIQEAKRLKIQVDDTRVKGRMSEIKSSYETPREYQAYLAGQGMTEADMIDKIRDQMLIYGLIDSTIKSKISIKPAEITDFYNTNRKMFFKDEERAFLSITSDNQETLVKFKEGIAQNKPTEDVAKELGLTVNSFSAVRGKELKKEIEDAVFALPLEQFSDLVKIDTAYYLFKVTKVTAGVQQELAQVQSEISKALYDRRLQEGVVAMLDKLKKKAFIKVME